MRLIVWLVRVALVLLLVRLLLRFVAGVVRGVRGEGPSARASRTRAPGGDLVRDRVCNTFVPRATALRASVAGREEHFCSPACRDKALAAAR